MENIKDYTGTARLIPNTTIIREKTEVRTGSE